MEKINHEPTHKSSQNSESWNSIEQAEQERGAGIIHKLGKTALEIVRKITKKPESETTYEASAPKSARIDGAWWYKNVYLPEQENKASVTDSQEDIITDSDYSDEKLLADMLTARQYFDQRETERNQNRHNERAQELFERELNGRLTTVGQLIDAIKAGESGIRGHSISYDGAWIPVITLEGFPYAMLTHTVDYRGKDVEGNNESGRKTAQAVVDDPSIWAEDLNKVQAQSDYGVAFKKNTRGNVLSASYTNSEHNMQTSFLKTGRDLTYGFNGVNPDSVIRVVNSDGMTPNMIGEDPTQMHRTGYLRELEETPTHAYNEVTLRRYDPNGKPKLPDYIVAKDGQISEAALRHAKYFGIPIVDIKTDIYKKQQKARAREILDSIDLTEPYPSLRKKVDKLYGLDSIGVDSGREQRIGLWTRITSGVEKNGTKLGEDIAKAEITDTERGLDYIEEQLREQIQKIRDALKNGDSVKTLPESFDMFEVSSTDVREFKQKTYDSRLGYGVMASNIDRNLGPEATNHMNIVFKLKGSPRETNITIYDGKHPIGGAEYVQQEADSRYYEKLAPLINEYLDLLAQHGL